MTFQEVRAHLGVETQRQWSDRAIARTTPILMGLFSWTTLAAHLMQEQRPMSHRTAAWYAKPSPTFVDAIALVRRHLWLASEGFSLSAADPDIRKVPAALYHRLVDSLAYAACNVQSLGGHLLIASPRRHTHPFGGLGLRYPAQPNVGNI